MTYFHSALVQWTKKKKIKNMLFKEAKLMLKLLDCDMTNGLVVLSLY